MPLLASLVFRVRRNAVFPCVSECYDDEPTTPVFSGEDATKPEVPKCAKNGRGRSQYIWHYMALILDCLRTVIGSKTLFRNIFVRAEITNLESKTPVWEFVDSIEHLANMSTHRRVWHGDTLVGYMGYDSILCALLKGWEPNAIFVHSKRSRSIPWN